MKSCGVIVFLILGLAGFAHPAPQCMESAKTAADGCGKCGGKYTGKIGGRRHTQCDFESREKDTACIKGVAGDQYKRGVNETYCFSRCSEDKSCFKALQWYTSCRTIHCAYVTQADCKKVASNPKEGCTQCGGKYTDENDSDFPVGWRDTTKYCDFGHFISKKWTRRHGCVSENFDWIYDAKTPMECYHTCYQRGGRTDQLLKQTCLKADWKKDWDPKCTLRICQDYWW